MWLGFEYSTHSQAELVADHSHEISTFRHGRPTTDRRTDDKLCHERDRYDGWSAKNREYLSLGMCVLTIVKLI